MPGRELRVEAIQVDVLGALARAQLGGLLPATGSVCQPSGSRMALLECGA